MHYRLICILSLFLSACGPKEAHTALTASVVQSPPQSPSPEAEPTPQAPTQPEAILQAQSLYNDAKYDEARQTLQGYLMDEPNDTAALVLLAKVDLAAAAPDIALLSVKRAIQLEPQNAQAQLVLAQAYFLQPNDAAALSALTECIKLDPTLLEAQLLGTKISLRFLNYPKALEYAKAAFELEPHNTRALLAYADALYANKDYNEAALHYENAIKSLDNSQVPKRALIRLATIYEEQLQDSPNACRLYTHLHQLEPENKNYQASKQYHCK